MPAARLQKISRRKGYETNMKNKKIIASLTAMALIPSAALADVSYTVQKGDSYWNISQRFNTSLNSLLNANNASGNSSLMVGQIISVPSNTYTVQKGDTYYLIAKKCGVNCTKIFNVFSILLMTLFLLVCLHMRLS